MIESLHIQDYALIRTLNIEFGPGFNVLTGETGAGKSIVIGALGLALGTRASAEVVRRGADKAVIEAVFRLNKASTALQTLLEESELALDEGALILSRIVSADGRSRALINGRPVTISLLGEIGDELVDLHGQHEHQSLFRSDCQLRLLDAFAGTTEQAETLAKKVSERNRIRRELEALQATSRDQARQIDFMRFEIQEINEAALIPDEEEELRERLKRITHAEAIRELSQEACQRLYDAEGSSAIDALDGASNALDKIREVLPEFKWALDELAEIRARVENVAEEMRCHSEDRDFDPEEINVINERLNLINTLKRKYGAQITDILAYRDKTTAALFEYDHQDERLEVLQKEETALSAETEKEGTALSSARKKAARRMDKEIQDALHRLDMPNARFETDFESISLGMQGQDRISFLLAANAGEKPKSLRLVASGGEVSRIMLAIKAVFANHDPIPTLVFDEIDAGIGGATARRVSDKIRALAASRQLLCITHLAQIAAPAAAHYKVLKEEEKGEFTTTQVIRMTGEEREKEMARLLDGSVSPASLRHARALLKEFH
ncbi:MAG: DNA repair protein RecN [Candidatus Hydrogenedens sp.]|jgi:DNA repair protein RecN (Recombination protein N)|nr:DNA repair protein RecN [Candidatus Hydrogenedens sp.]